MRFLHIKCNKGRYNENKRLESFLNLSVEFLNESWKLPVGGRSSLFSISSFNGQLFLKTLQGRKDVTKKKKRFYLGFIFYLVLMFSSCDRQQKLTLFSQGSFVCFQRPSRGWLPSCSLLAFRLTCSGGHIWSSLSPPVPEIGPSVLLLQGFLGEFLSG